MQVDKQKRPLIVLPENSNTALASVLETSPPATPTLQKSFMTTVEQSYERVKRGRGKITSWIYKFVHLFFNEFLFYFYIFKI